MFFVKPPFVEIVSGGSYIDIELVTSETAVPLHAFPKGIASRSCNFDSMENIACDISRDLGIPIVYTEDYLALKNSVIQQELI